MVGAYGWKAEEDYSVYPENKWCDYDYVAAWIKSVGYEPKTSIENLVRMVIAHYDMYLEENNVFFYTDITKSENQDGWMISTNDVSCFVEENGGLSEFDYEC